MSQKVWLGGIYLKDEGGYELVLRSLEHYKKRLRLIERSPEIKDAPMFAQIILQEAMKTHQAIGPLIAKIKTALQSPETLSGLQADIPLLEKALNCYHSDIQKAENASDIFYSELVSDKELAKADYTKIKTALERIAEFS